MNTVQKFEYHRKVCPVCLAADKLPIGEMQDARCAEGQLLADAAVASCFGERRTTVEHDLHKVVQELETTRQMDCQDVILTIMDETIVRTR